MDFFPFRRAAVGLLLLDCVAASSASLPQALRSCASLRDDRERVACYDREVARLAADAAPEPAPTPTLLAQEQKLGLSGESLRAPKVTELHARVSSVSQRSDGLALFTLDNDQVWIQTEKQSNFSARPGDQVTVSRGALGSFWLALDAHLATRVKRLR